MNYLCMMIQLFRVRVAICAVIEIGTGLLIVMRHVWTFTDALPMQIDTFS